MIKETFTESLEMAMEQESSDIYIEVSNEAEGFKTKLLPVEINEIN